MNPLDFRKNIAAFSQQMARRIPPSEEQYAYLAEIFDRIAKGENANEVLGVAFTRGRSLKDAKHRQALSSVIQWIECVIVGPDSNEAGRGLTIKEACDEAAPMLRELLGIPGSEKYDAEYVRQCFYNPAYAHMRSPTRTHFEQDSPF